MAKGVDAERMVLRTCGKLCSKGKRRVPLGPYCLSKMIASMMVRMRLFRMS